MTIPKLALVLVFLMPVTLGPWQVVAQATDGAGASVTLGGTFSIP